MSNNDNSQTEGAVSAPTRLGGSRGDARLPDQFEVDGTDSFDIWEQDFRQAAFSDNCTTLATHLKRLELPGPVDLILEGTIDFVRASVAYLRMDGRGVIQFLANQRYTPQAIDTACYLITFDVAGRSYGRVVVSQEFKYVDLADLFNHPWWRIKAAGYAMFWVSRIDGQKLTSREVKELKRTVKNDLRFDYIEDELLILFDSDTVDGALCVALQET